MTFFDEIFFSSFFINKLIMRFPNMWYDIMEQVGSHCLTQWIISILWISAFLIIQEVILSAWRRLLTLLITRKKLSIQKKLIHNEHMNKWNHIEQMKKFLTPCLIKIKASKISLLFICSKFLCWYLSGHLL